LTKRNEDRLSAFLVAGWVY